MGGGWAHHLPAHANNASISTPENAAASVIEDNIDSVALGRKMKLLVWRPPGYTESRHYPVVYLFHGMRENQAFWQNLGAFDTAAHLVESKRIEPMLIVTPQLDNSFGVNNVQTVVEEMPRGGPVTLHGGRYEDFLATDLIEFIDKRYATQANRAGRRVGGISMGGFAALHLAMRHPQLFSRVGAHSPALVGSDWKWLFPPEAPPAQRDVQLLAAQRDLSGLRFYIDCGEEDDYKFADPTRRLVQTLQARKLPVQAQLRPGRHSSDYWQSHLEEYLNFYGGV
jgi:enterochelin esterase-like enzyme